MHTTPYHLQILELVFVNGVHCTTVYRQPSTNNVVPTVLSVSTTYHYLVSSLIAETSRMEESFEDCVAHLMIMMEEVKRNLSASPQDHVLQLDAMMGRLNFLRRQHQDHVDDEVKRDMYYNCHYKVQQVARLILDRSVESSATDKTVFDDDIPGQAAVARIAELNLLLCTTTLMEEDPEEEASKLKVSELISLYANYQKQVLRQRAKPAIAHLASWRKSDLQQRQTLTEEHDDDDDAITQPHSHALTFVLGHASALIHPLQQWNDTLPPESATFRLCTTSIQILHEQTSLLVKSVCDWFLQDKKVDQWMQQQQMQHQTASKADLPELDALVEEMAFCCQVMARYTALTADSAHVVSNRTIQQELLPEWTWKYAALERFLGVQQLQSALELATPVDIVIGSNIQVPSVVEDAQYLSTRALDRAMSTRNSQAMGTVAHSLSHDVWSTDGSGVYQALLDRMGCYTAVLESPKPKGTSSTTSAPKSGDFASALLDALDQDLKTAKAPPSASMSGGFLGSLVMGAEGLQVRLDTQLCAMNGVYAASTACQSLVESLDSWLEEQEDRMIGLARDELMRFSHAYKAMLQQEVVSTIVEWCGSLEGQGASLKGKCLHALRDSMEREVYQLDASAFANAELDDRLEALWLRPLKESILICSIDKCEVEVGFAICQELSKQIADLILECIWQSKIRFTDWGSMLLSKQVRLLQTYMMDLLTEDAGGPSCNSIASTSVHNQWERLSQVVTVLQLERPSDWSIYQSTSVLTMEELRRTLSLRVDFSPEAINAVCQAQNKK